MASSHFLRPLSLQRKEVTGIYHLSTAGEISWYGFTKEILEYLKKLEDYKSGETNTN